MYPDQDHLEISSRYLVIEGWAAKLGCTQTEVSLIISGKRFSCTNINTWSPSIGQTLPSIEQAMRSHFGVVIERTELYLPSWSHRRFYAEIKFSDGSIFKLPKARIKWNKPIERLPISKKRGKGILFISNNLRATEGAPRVLYEVIKLAVSLGHRVGVISPLGGELEDSLNSLGVELHIIPDLYLAHYSRIQTFTNQTEKAKKVVEEFDPSVVFGNTIEAFWGVSYAEHLGIKTIWLIHESIDPKLAFEELDPRARVLFLEALDGAHNIFVSNSTEKLFSNS